MIFKPSSLLPVLLWLGSCTAYPHLETRQTNTTGYHWVDTWTSMPQLVEPDNLPPAPFRGGSAILSDATLRQTFHISLSSERIRIQFSNTFGTTDLPIASASLALPLGGKAGVKDIQPSLLAGLTFNGSSSVTIQRGKTVYSDPVDFAVKAQSIITVSMYLAKGQAGSSITGHPGSRTTSWMQAGNKVNASSVMGTSTKHWYFATAVEAWAPKNASAFIILGDSITDGRGSDDDMNNRWPDLLLAKMVKSGITNISVNNQAAGGNRVLADGLGPSLISRYTRDAITQSGVKYVLLFIGVNDIGSASTDSGTQTQISNSLISAFKTIITDCKKNKLAVFGATITPFGGSGQSYSNPEREKSRKKVNDWILGKEAGFDAVVDFAKIVADPNNPSQLKSTYDGGDHLHPNGAGYQAMAEGFPIEIFKKFEGAAVVAFVFQLQVQLILLQHTTSKTIDDYTDLTPIAPAFYVSPRALQTSLPTPAHPYSYPAIHAQLYYITILIPIPIPESHPPQSLQVNIESIGLCMVTRGVGQTQVNPKYHNSFQLHTLPTNLLSIGIYPHRTAPRRIAYCTAKTRLRTRRTPVASK
ncbi:SGNH hydrolase [Cadophora sp. DSE1049]|nr:SGNH hydrolase [Cadophora sp. DSE1049]